MSVSLMINRSALVAGAACLAGMAFLSGANPARAVGFSGDYDPSNWTLTNEFANGFADGFVDITHAPLAITMQGSDSGSGSFGQTSYTTLAQSDGLLSFDWDYTTFDSLPVYDLFGFLLNGDLTELIDGFGPDSQSGNFSFSVLEGDVFGFSILTDDDAFGPASVTISNFHAPTSEPPDVPEPASMAGLLILGALSAGSVLKQKQAQNA